MARVLLVDADTVTAQAMVLECQGHVVATAKNGEAALRLCKEFLPDVILLDILLPGMNGIDLARKIRESTADAPPRLLALTGYPRAEAAAGSELFDGFLLKPVTLAALNAAISG